MMMHKEQHSPCGMELNMHERMHFFTWPSGMMIFDASSGFEYFATCIKIAFVNSPSTSIASVYLQPSAPTASACNASLVDVPSKALSSSAHSSMEICQQHSICAW